MESVGGNLHSDTQQMAPLIIREYGKVDQDPFRRYITIVRNVVNVVRGYVLYVLNVRNRCVLKANSELLPQCGKHAVV